MDEQIKLPPIDHEEISEAVRAGSCEFVKGLMRSYAERAVSAALAAQPVPYPRREDVTPEMRAGFERLFSEARKHNHGTLARNEQGAYRDLRVDADWIFYQRAWADALAAHKPDGGDAVQEFIDATDALLESQERKTWTSGYAKEMTVGERMAVAARWRKARAALVGQPDLRQDLDAAKRDAMPDESALDALINVHQELVEDNPYCYFELAHTRQTGWMAWITDKPLYPVQEVANPDRKVLARGQGESAEEACRIALAAIAQQRKGE